MAYTTPFTAVTGATILASGWNTSARDNIISLWVFTTAGDMVYASSSTALARLALGASGTVIMSDGTKPTYAAKYAAPGMVDASYYAQGTPNQTFAGAWADITGATISLNPPGASNNVLLIATVTGYSTNNGSGNGFFVRGVIGATADATPTLAFMGSFAPPTNLALPYIYWLSGIASGAITVKLQCQADSGVANYVTSFRMSALMWSV